MEVLGLFPLHIVLFPEASYPLHIFEERYKQLVSESLASRGEFGINLVEGGKMFDVGCRVRVTRILKDYPDGRKDIIVTGTTRYKVLKIRPADRNYITAEVHPYDDTYVEAEPDGELIGRVTSLYNELIERVYGSAGERVENDRDDHPILSYKIAQKSGLDLMLRQRLLEMRSEDERLQFLIQHLTMVLPKIRRADHIRMISKNDGYLEI